MGGRVSAAKGTNGIKDGKANVESFLGWIADVADFKPFVREGVLSVSRVARECGLNRDVFYSNPDIRTVHWPALVKRLEDEGVLKIRVAAPSEAVVGRRERSSFNDSRIKQIQEENEAVKAENRELRKQLEKFKGMEEVLHTTGRLPW